MHGATVAGQVVNCAGAGRWLMLDEATVEEVAACYHAPLLAAANMCRAFTADMKSRHAGAFVQVQSPGGVTSWRGSTAYISARWALRGLTLALQADLRDTGIQVQEVMLPEVDSGYWLHNPGSRQRVPWLGKLLGVPTISARKAAVYVARAIESRAAFSCFGGALPLMTELNLLLPRFISRLISWSACSYSRCSRHTQTRHAAMKRHACHAACHAAGCAPASRQRALAYTIAY